MTCWLVCPRTCLHAVPPTRMLGLTRMLCPTRTPSQVYAWCLMTGGNRNRENVATKKDEQNLPMKPVAVRAL